MYLPLYPVWNCDRAMLICFGGRTPGSELVGLKVEDVVLQCSSLRFEFGKGRRTTSIARLEADRRQSSGGWRSKGGCRTRIFPTARGDKDDPIGISMMCSLACCVQNRVAFASKARFTVILWEGYGCDVDAPDNT